MDTIWLSLVALITMMVLIFGFKATFHKGVTI